VFECERLCPRQLAQVCDQHGTVYNNKCLFDIAKCKDNSLVLSNNNCNIDVLPDVTENNNEDSNNSKKDKCERLCPRHLAQVCDQHGTVYNNKCLFDIAKCKNNNLMLTKKNCNVDVLPDLTEVKEEIPKVVIEVTSADSPESKEKLCKFWATEGHCKTNEYVRVNCVAACTPKNENQGPCKDVVPQCTNWKYLCNDDQYSFILKVICPKTCQLCSNPPAPVIKPKCERLCSRQLAQVCDQHGKVYNNRCVFDIAKCKDNSLILSNKDCNIDVLPDITENENEESNNSKKGKCERLCSRQLAQVCDQYGKVYNNKCVFDIAKCKDNSLVLTEMNCNVDVLPDMKNEKPKKESKKIVDEVKHRIKYRKGGEYSCLVLTIPHGGKFKKMTGYKRGPSKIQGDKNTG
jgi:hypothetical protein